MKLEEDSQTEKGGLSSLLHMIIKYFLAIKKYF